MTPETFNKLERALAYSAARSDIEMLCKGPACAPGKPLEWDISTELTDRDDAMTLENAIQYLEYRGLLKRRIDNPNIVTILDES